METGALDYHERTKHTPKSVREGASGLNFDNKPRPYKEYVELPNRSLADRIRPPLQPALAAVAESTPNGDPDRDQRPDLETVTNLCYYAAGITKTIDLRGRTKRFRAPATTGALYHVDLYVICGDLEGGDESASETADTEKDLAAGVYHFDPRTCSLDVLREGDFRGVLAASTEYEAVADAPLSIVATSTWWRNAWKYEARTFRHAFWDSGTTLANLLAVAHALDYRAEVVTGFADQRVADLLGVDPEREAPLEVVPIGVDGGSDAEPAVATVDPIDPDTAPLSPNEKQFPLIHEAWEAGTLADGAAAKAWRARGADGDAGTDPNARIGRRDPGDGERVPLDPVDHETASQRPLHRTIRRRGSCREYEREPISFRKFSTVLDRAVRGVPMDTRPADAPPLSFVDPYLIVNGVEGLESGTYHYHPEAGELERLQAGEFRREARHLALDQRLGETAAVCLYFVTDLAEIVDALGDRGYRVAQLEASLTAGRLYLATYAHRDLGGTGLTFYDDIVADFFSPRAAGQTPMFLYTMGRPA